MSNKTTLPYPQKTGASSRCLLPLFGLMAVVAPTQASTDWPPAEWRPACDGHWSTSGYGKRMYVIHDMEGYYESGRAYLQRCDISVSIHYMVNGKPDGSGGLPGGECAQNIRDAYYGWHARCWNKYSMGTEHEGFASSPAWYTPAMFATSSAITAAKCDKYGIAKDRNHIVAHGQKAVAGWPAWASANLGVDPNCNTHHDPGPYWNWTDYMARVGGGGGSTPVNGAAAVSVSAPASVEVGQTFSSTVTMNNNGTKNWIDTTHKLGSQDPQDNSRWGLTRVAFSGTITPGQNKAFTFNSTAPTTAGSYAFSWKMLEEGVEWFGATASAGINVITVNNASAVSISKPASVSVGAVFSATITMNNNGSKPWTVAGSYKLGSQNPQDNARWGTGRVNLPGTINPGANGAITANFTAPTTPGVYAFDWKMVQDGVEWFGATATSTITVTAALPAAPSGLEASAASWDQVNLSWTDNSNNETGFRVERSTDNVNFTQFISVGAGITTTSDPGRNPGTTYYYRVRSYNADGNSAYSATASATTPTQPPVLGVIGGKTGTEGQQLTFTVTSSNPNALVTTTTFQNYESFSDNTANGTVMFRQPVYSGSTSAFLDTTVTNYTSVKSSFPAGGANGSRALKTSWSFKTGTTNPWLRLTTALAANIPNPTIDLDHVLKFDLHTDKALKVAFTARETGTAAAYGADGGSTGGVEFVGVTGTTGGQPQATRSIAAGAWTTLSFNIPFEGAANFSGGDGAVSSGIKGVLEQLSLVPNGGMGVYTIHVDNFAVVVTNNLTYSLDAGAPAGTTIHPKTGVFKWTPSSGQAGNHTITVRVTDRLGLVDYETIAVSIIAAGNHKPVLGVIGNKAVNEGSALTFTATATDQDAGQTKTFTLDAGNPSGSSINSSSGAFAWTPTEAQGPGSYPITVRVTDNGSPSSNDFETITVTVSEVNVAPSLAAISNQTISEGSALNLTAVGSDTDLPANSLTYSLDDGSPVGMTINSGNGAIAWTTGETDGPGAYPVTARVTDAGGLSATAAFTVTVNEANQAPSLNVPTTVTTVESVTDVEAYDDTSYNGTVLFRQPSFSSTTSAFIDTATNNYVYVRTLFPTGNQSTKALQASFSFKTGTTNPWLRLGTYNTASVPNPTIRSTERVRMDVYTDKSIKLGLIIRETGTSAQVGQNGGVTGTLEYVGVSGLTGSMPNPTRTISAGAWTTVEFNLPSESVTAFTGDGVLSSATGKAVLDSLAVVPNAGTGLYNVYIDNVVVATVKNNYTVDTGSTLAINTISSADTDFPAQALTYSLDGGAPAGAAIHASTGVFTWTPVSAQGPSTNVITIRVTDNGPGSLSASQNITVVVNKVNTAPKITGVPEQAVELNGGAAINITLAATDDDLPADTLTFSLQGTPPSGSSIHPTTGVFTWTPLNVLSTNIVTVRVTDNGSPALYDEKDMTIIITPTNTAPALSLGVARVTERFVGYETFTNNTPNGTVMFRQPIFSGSSSLHIDSAVTNYTRVTTSFPAGNPNGSGSKVLITSLSFKTGTTNPWVRLITASVANVVNPTIDLTARVKVDVYSAGKAIKVALGARETGTTANIGADGGATGGIEWLGCTKFSNGSPNPSRTVNADTWTTLEFNLPAEFCTNFSSGNSVLAGGKGVLEHLAIVPAGTLGVYTIYLDNFEVVSTPALPSTISMNVNSSLTFTAGATDPDPGAGLSFGLDADAATNATINSSSGAFAWTPTSAGTTNISVTVNDDPTNGALPKSTTQIFTVIVGSDPLAPFGANGGGVVGAGETVSITWDSVTGAKYKVQFRDAGGSDWTDAGLVEAADASTTIAVANDGGERYYRVIALDGADE